MITTDRMKEIQFALMDGKPVKAKNREERDFIKKARNDINKVRRDGYIVDVVKD